MSAKVQAKAGAPAQGPAEPPGWEAAQCCGHDPDGYHDHPLGVIPSRRPGITTWVSSPWGHHPGGITIRGR